MAHKIIIGNWKMNPSSEKKAKELYQNSVRAAKRLKKARVVLCVPYIYLHSLASLSGAPRLSLGAQDVFYEKEGAHTGEISISMLKDAGVKHVIVGHSERRSRGETNSDVNKKLRAVLTSGMTAIACVGEEERDTQGRYYDYLQREIEETCAGVAEHEFKRFIVAYEPLWAIGASSDEALGGEGMHEMTIFIRKVLTDIYGNEAARDVRVIYGGSVTASNAEDIFARGHVDGVLPGRASRDSDEYAAIISIADRTS